MRIAVLGPLEVLRDDAAPVEVPGEAERLLLGALAAAVPDAVGVDRLIGILGLDGGPESARESFQGHVQALRSALDPDLPERSSGRYVLRRGDGYVLAVARGEVDAAHAADLVARGRSRLATGENAEAVRLLTAALALWRGVPYADWPGVRFADAERQRLTDLRAAAETALKEARLLLDRQPDAPPRTFPARVSRAVPAEPPTAAGEQRDDDPPPEAPAVPDEPAEATRVPATATLAPAGPPSPRIGRWLAALAAVVAAVLVATVLSSRSDRAHEQAATVARADRLAVQSATETPLDVSLLLAAQAFRLADTSATRETLRSELLRYGRVERVASFVGIPQDPVLSGGGRALTFGIGNDLEHWLVGPRTQPQLLMSIPADWNRWLVSAGSPTEQVLLAAGGAPGQPWVRTISAVDGSSRLLAGGDGIGGRPIDGVVTPDGRRFLLLVAQPDPASPGNATRWRLVDFDVRNGTQRDTGLAGSIEVPLLDLRADFSDDATSFVLWGSRSTADAVLVDVSGGPQASIPSTRGPQGSAGFRALSSGLAQLWFDGSITLFDRRGVMVQWVDFHTSAVRDVVVAPDGTWAVTGDSGSEVVRWDVDPDSGRWSRPQVLVGHHGGVVGLELGGDGEQLFSVSMDSSVIVWDMRSAGGREAERMGRPADAAGSVWLHDACAVVGRDLDPNEWRRYLPDLPFRPTCSDLR